MAIFTALAVAGFLGIETGFFATAVAFALNAAVVGVAEVAVSYAAKALAGNQNQPASATDHFGVQATIAGGGDVPRSFNIGYSSTAGSLVYANFWGTDGHTPNSYFTQVIALADLPGGTLLEVWVNGELCTLGEVLDPNVGAPVIQYRTPDGDDHVWVKYYDGTQTTADTLLVSSVASADRPYPSTRVGVGVAYVVCTSLVEDTLFTGFPSFKFGLSGIPLYDPSKDDTAGGSGSQRYSDPTTWGGDGDNFPAVQIYNIVRGLSYSDIWLYGLQNMSAARLPPANWITQIAKCRAAITGVDGDEPTYRSGMQISVDTQPLNAIKTLLTACQGKVSSIAGFYKIHLGTPDSPSFSFTDDDILSTEIQVFRPFFALADSVNGIQATYPDPTQGWNTTTAPPLYRSDLEALDGNRRLMANPAFDAVPYAAQVQRLQKSAIDEAQRARTHNIVLPPEYWTVEPGDVGTWTSARNGYEDKQFRVDGAIDQANLDSGLSVTEVDPSDYDWDHSTDFKPVTSGPTVIPRPAPQGILDWVAEPYILTDADGTNRRPAIRLSWAADMPGVDGVLFAIRRADDLTVILNGNTLALSAGAIIISQNLLPDFAYQAQGQYIPSWPRDMLPSDWLDVTTPDVRLSLADFDAGVTSQVTDVIDALSDDVAQLNQRMSALVSKLGAQGWDDIRSVRSQLFATFGDAAAEIDEVRTVAVDAQNAVADLSTTVTATFGPAFSTVSSVTTAVAGINGWAAAQYAVTLDVNGYVSGLNLVNGGPGFSTFTIKADKIAFVLPGVNGGAPVTFLSTGTIGGVPAIALSGQFIVDGLIKTNMIDAAQVTAVQMAANSVTAANAAIAAAAVNTLSIAGNAVTQPAGQLFTTPVTLTNTVQRDCGGFTLNVSTAGAAGQTLKILYTVTCSLSLATLDSVRIQIKINGVADSVIDVANASGGSVNMTGTTVGIVSFTASGGIDSFAFDMLGASGQANVSTFNSGTIWALGAKR